jgi:hypothetical protein
MACVHLFFLKDILLPATRNPQRTFLRIWVLLALAITWPVALWQLRREGRVSEITAEAVLWGVVMVLPSITAYLHGLGSLGREGPVLALMRPVVRPATLWRYKVLAVLVTVLSTGVIYGALTGAVAAGLGLEPGPRQGAGLGGLAAVVATPIAVALGFLFPDFRCQSALATGAAWPARRLFEGLALYGIGTGAAARVMTRTGVLPPDLLGAVLIITAGFAVTLAGILTLFALSRFTRLET